MRDSLVRITRRAIFGVVALVSTFAPTRAAAQAGENLQVLSDDLTRPELMGIMRQFSFALGVRCEFCHDAPDDVPFNDRNFQSDEKAPKEKARRMIKMVMDINEKYLALLPDRRSPGVEVSCITCHGGISRPEQIDRIVERLIAEDDLDFAVQRYRELREQYHGGAAFDFREQPLVQLGSRLVRAENTTAAKAILELNLEFNPRSGQTLIGLGQVAEAENDTAGAIGWYERALEISPDNPQVQRRLQQLRGGE